MKRVVKFIEGRKEIQNLALVVVAAVAMSMGWWRATGLTMLVGFVPLLVVASRYDASRRSLGRMLGWVSLFIVLWYAMTVWWVWFATPAGPVAATFFGWFYTGLAFMVWFFVSKRGSKALSYTVLVTVWTLGEWAYNHSQASFPWLNIGNGFAHEPWLVQWYEWTGIYGGTVWALVSSIVVYEFLVARRFAWKNVIAPSVVVILPIVVSISIYFFYDEPVGRSAKITIVQPNIESYTEKFTLPQRVQTAGLIELAGEAPQDVDFILMPETAINEGIVEGEFDRSPSLDRLRSFAEARYPRSMVIVGATTFRPYGEEKKTSTARGNSRTGFYDVYNTALAMLPNGNIELHHKSRLVIGVEMMPDWWWVRLTGLDKLVTKLGGMSGQLGYDTRRKVFALADTIRIGAAICYESIYGEYFAGFVRHGAGAMTIITNDGWWGNTPGYRQHFDFARLRAIETRRALARSANTGRSGFITARGDVAGTMEWDERGTLTDEVSLSDELTFYVRFGDWICRISLMIFTLSMLYFVAWSVRKRSLLVEK